MPSSEKTDEAADRLPERRSAEGDAFYHHPSTHPEPDLVGLLSKVTRLIDEYEAGAGDGQEGGEVHDDTNVSAASTVDVVTTTLESARTPPS